MKKTLLLCFIHGFKGGDDTFGSFPEHLRALVSHGMPKVDVKAIVYPKFETRGDLAECVAKFREWLQTQVIDIEVSNSTPSPTIDPSVHTILIGHSMGGIVAADAVLSLATDIPIDSSSSSETFNANLFPYVQGVLAFDTPYLGISPGVVAHGAEGHYIAATSALAQFSSLTSTLWGPKEATGSSQKEKKEESAPIAKEAPATAAASAWGTWAKMAMVAGAAGLAAAGGTAAYLNREQITSGWSWAFSHLEFVGCLAKPEQLQKRTSMMVRLNQELHIGFANLYTRLGKKAMSKDGKGTFVGTVMGNKRTFCSLPKTKEVMDFFQEAINDAAADECGAHMTMFFPKDNPGYYNMSEEAKKWIILWNMNEWYGSSTKEGMDDDGDF